jgi:alcohol dehydrogenase class IV
MTRFEFATATRTLFGPGVLREVAPAVAGMGRRALVVTGRSTDRAAPLLASLREQGVEATCFGAAGEPTIDSVAAGLARAREADCEVVIGFGGGSALDTGKAIAALLTNGGEPLDYLEVVGRGQPLAQPSAPYVAIPTTAGTGGEVTRNAVLASPQHHVKASLRSPYMLPRLAAVDPELTYSLPSEVTARTGLDALTQIIEPFVGNKANPLTDALCREGIHRAARSLRRACQEGTDAAAREDMALASLFGGLALANSKLGAVHGLAGPLGGALHAPHGAICARLLPIVMETNLRALRSRAPDSPALARYAEVAQLLTGDPAASAEAGVAWVQELCASLPITSLGRFGLAEADFPALVTQAQKASSMKGNPVSLSELELVEVLQRAT